MEDADETHFIFKMANRKLLGSRGDMVVQYADIVSGGYSIKMMVRLTGVGGRDGSAPYAHIDERKLHIPHSWGL